MTQMNLCRKQQQTHRRREQKGGEGREGGGLRGQGKQTQTIIYRMDKQQGPRVCGAGNYIQYLVINHNRKEFKKHMYN